MNSGRLTTTKAKLAALAGQCASHSWQVVGTKSKRRRGRHTDGLVDAAICKPAPPDARAIHCALLSGDRRLGCLACFLHRCVWRLKVFVVPREIPLISIPYVAGTLNPVEL